MKIYIIESIFVTVQVLSCDTMVMIIPILNKTVEVIDYIEMEKACIRRVGRVYILDSVLCKVPQDTAAFQAVIQQQGAVFQMVPVYIQQLPAVRLRPIHCLCLMQIYSSGWKPGEDICQCYSHFRPGGGDFSGGHQHL